MPCRSKVLIILVFYSAFVSAKPAINTTDNNVIEQCNNDCPSEQQPVCGALYLGASKGYILCTFQNICKLYLQQCEKQERWIAHNGRCDSESRCFTRDDRDNAAVVMLLAKPETSFGAKLLGLAYFFERSLWNSIQKNENQMKSYY
ncbi:uncharacterized protein LOC106089855 [Stomoxys calcitrans]|uniref:uncharacterized protein LOC106089855 n=1 Tax=Stomoxys calcitrans TaxID=35570 RepID=UPI0027E2E256|nr:uncharacterized protein LOC106089855 [Stomoxys calcitrans]